MHTNTTTGHISGDENRRTTGFEFAEDPITFTSKKRCYQEPPTRTNPNPLLTVPCHHGWRVQANRLGEGTS